MRLPHFFFVSFCFILLRLNYCSPTAINFGSCEPKGKTATREAKKCGTKSEALLLVRWLPRALDFFFFWFDVTWAEQIALATHRDLCRIIYTCKRVCCTAIFDRNIIMYCMYVWLLWMPGGECARVNVCASKRKQQIRFAEFKNKHWE